MKKIFLMCIILLCLCVSCRSEFKTLVGNDENNKNTIEMLKNIKCANEHLEDTYILDFDSVYFGRYEQDGIIENGKEEIEWIVLEKDFVKNEVTLMSKYALDYIKYADNFHDLTEQQQNEIIINMLTKNGVDVNYVKEAIYNNSKESSDYDYFKDSIIRSAKSTAYYEYYNDEYMRYGKSHLYTFSNNNFYNEAFNDNEKQYIIDNNQIINGIEYESQKIILPTEDVLTNNFINDFQRRLYGTIYCIDNENCEKEDKKVLNGVCTLSINHPFDYVYVNDENVLKKISNGKLSNEYNGELYMIGFRPIIRVTINDLIKQNIIINDNLPAIEIEENPDIAKFIKDYDIKLKGVYKLYQVPLFNIYNELRNYNNSNRNTGKDYGTFGYTHYEVMHDNEEKYMELSYKLVDMDNDNCNELIIFNSNQLLEIYTIYKNTLRHLYTTVRGSSLGHIYRYYITDNNELYYSYCDAMSDYHIYFILKDGALYKRISYTKKYDSDYGLYECNDFMNNKEYNVNEHSIYPSDNNKLNNSKNKNVIERNIKILYDYKEGIKLSRPVTDSTNNYLIKFSSDKYGHYDYDVITFGKYYDYKDIKTGLNWIVLEKNEDKALILCENVIDCKCFDDKNIEITYKDSSIRKWLNETFYNESFSNTDKKNIIETEIQNIDLQGNKNDDTTDKVFLLSLDEVKKYFGELDNIEENNSYGHIVHNNKASAFPTDYAKKIDNLGEKLFYSTAEDKDYNGACEWWLRTMNSNKKSTAIVYCNGYAEGLEKEHLINYKNRGVRPAMWVKIK